MPIRLTSRELPSAVVDDLERLPTHEVTAVLSQAALDGRCLPSGGFKKLLAFLLEKADGRDRREPWTNRPGDVRPVPKLRMAMEECFGVYGDVHWFNLNKKANAAGRPLTGLFPRFSLALARVSAEDLAAVIRALLADAPDAALLRLLQHRGGQIPHIGAELFANLAFAHRRDLYFTLPRPWAESSGCLKYVGRDLRKYCELCRNLRGVCDDLGVPAAVRGSVLDHLLSEPWPPSTLLEAISGAIGPSLASFVALAPADAYETGGDDDPATIPSDFAAATIRGRRGDRRLRQALRQLYGDQCAVTGTCIPDLLEVAYLRPYPREEGPSPGDTLLLRADVHTLLDLNLIGVEPKKRRIYVAPELAGTIYEELAGRKLPKPDGDGPGVEGKVLRDRWRMFISAHPTASGGAEEPAPRARKVAPRRDGDGKERDPAEVVVTKRRREPVKPG